MEKLIRLLSVLLMLTGASAVVSNTVVSAATTGKGTGSVGFYNPKKPPTPPDNPNQPNNPSKPAQPNANLPQTGESNDSYLAYVGVLLVIVSACGFAFKQTDKNSKVSRT